MEYYDNYPEYSGAIRLRLVIRLWLAHGRCSFV
jgi:hypothetical protein